MGKISDTRMEPRFQVPGSSFQPSKENIACSLCVCEGVLFQDPPTSHPDAPTPDVNQKMDGCSAAKTGKRRKKKHLRPADNKQGCVLVWVR